MSARSSGTTSIAVTSAPASSASRASSGPDSSSASRRDTDVEMVSTAVRTLLRKPGASARVVQVRLGVEVAARGRAHQLLGLEPLAVPVDLLREPGPQRGQVAGLELGVEVGQVLADARPQ